MKKSNLRKVAWVFFALALGTTTVSAQGWGNGNRALVSQNYTCTNFISGLDDDQKAKISELESTHQEAMAGLRVKRQSTVDAIEKNEIRGEMLKKVKAHREAVKNLLTEEQQQQYDLLHSRGNNFRNMAGNGNFQGCGQFQGQQKFAGNNGRGCRGNRAGYGQGNGRGNRQFNRGCRMGNYQLN